MKNFKLIAAILLFTTGSAVSSDVYELCIKEAQRKVAEKRANKNLCAEEVSKNCTDKLLKSIQELEKPDTSPAFQVCLSSTAKQLSANQELSDALDELHSESIWTTICFNRGLHPRLPRRYVLPK